MMKNWLLKIAFSITRWVGRQHWPYIHKKMTAANCLAISKNLHPGDVLLSHNEGELSNVLISGFWKHAAIAVDSEVIVEAIGSGVRKCHIVDFAMKKDFVSVWRPAFASKEQRAVAADYAKCQVGTPYDYEFQSGNKAFYCSELVHAAYDHAMGGKSPFEMRPRYGILTVIPNDIARAEKKFLRLI